MSGPRPDYTAAIRARITGLATHGLTGVALTAGSGLLTVILVRGTGETLTCWLAWTVWIVIVSAAIVSLLYLVTAAVFAVIYWRRRDRLNADIAAMLRDWQQRLSRPPR